MWVLSLQKVEWEITTTIVKFTFDLIAVNDRLNQIAVYVRSLSALNSQLVISIFDSYLNFHFFIAFTIVTCIVFRLLISDVCHYLNLIKSKKNGEKWPIQMNINQLFCVERVNHETVQNFNWANARRWWGFLFSLVVVISWSNVVWRWFDSNFFMFSIQYRARDHTFWTGQLTTFTCHPFGFVNGDQSTMVSFALSAVFVSMIIIMMWELIFYAYLIFVSCLIFWYWTDDWRLETGDHFKIEMKEPWPIAYFKNAIAFFSVFAFLRLLEEINDSIG